MKHALAEQVAEWEKLTPPPQVGRNVYFILWIIVAPDNNMVYYIALYQVIDVTVLFTGM